MPTEAVGAGALLAILRDGRARTRTELMQVTGLARSTVSQRLDALLEGRWITPAGEAISSGGRPAVAFTFNGAARLVLAADIGATHTRIALTDLNAHVLAEQSTNMRIEEGPEHVLTWLVKAFGSLLAECDRTASELCGVGIGLPGPVEHSTGRPVNPPIMPGWDGFDVTGWLGSRLGVPVLVDNDVNIMALGEHWTTSHGVEHLLFVKVGTGIGCGIVTERRLHRGAQGAAGDIGHIRVAAAADQLCRCGNTGCLEAIAGGAALATRLAAGARTPPTPGTSCNWSAQDGRWPSSWSARQGGTSGRSWHPWSISSTRTRSSSAGTSQMSANTSWPASARSSTAARCPWPHST